ncbi:Kelch repeat-containing protein [Dyadobacter psychrophilus]|uniref:Galactose oxidase, central domain n=1 Tax=Dyadobacter psychrophilus TaxID=651661 RepID=A0A1T5HE73_9BACT|nr:kelch repeat-containing protein [Dyadobacter psychrophilus]SKC19013.1 hypothetical protein SAMN05660293_05405 [Dyadobacter psychrophilus]
MFNTLKKTSLALLVASTAFISLSCDKDDPEADKLGNWYRAGIPSFGGSARARAVSFVIGNKGYIGTGLTNETVQRVKDFWSYDATTKIWSQVAPFEGSGRNDAVAFVASGKAYVGLGFDGVTTVDGGYKKDFYQYDPATNKWTKKADFAGGTRQYATAFVTDNRAYVGLGWNGSGYYQDFYEYNIQTDKWTERATFTGGKRRGALAFTVGGKAYVGFGQTNSGSAEPKDLYSFDPAGNSGTGAWTRMEANTNDDLTGRTYALPLVINDKAYIVGGTGKSDTWEYTPGTNTWVQVATFEGGQRAFPAGFAIGNTGYVGTGGSITDDFWAFDPTAPVNADDNL